MRLNLWFFSDSSSFSSVSNGRGRCVNHGGHTRAYIRRGILGVPDMLSNCGDRENGS